MAAFKTHNVLQMVLVIGLTRQESRRLWLELAVATVFAISGVVLLVASVRARRVSRTAVSVDVMVTVAALLLAPLFQPVDPSQPWIDWPLFLAFLVAAEASACLSPALASAATLALMGATSTWLISGHLPPGPKQAVYASFFPFVAFALVSYIFLHYLRRMADLADARAVTIRMLEEERTRRVLHTPYRLLNDLAGMLRA